MPGASRLQNLRASIASLESAGREMDSNLSKIDSTTEPLQDSVKGVGDGVKETIENATDGDDKT